jgi:paraquat-inducible protein B
MEKLFSAGTVLWVVKPAIALSGISNLDTVVTGPYLTLLPGDGEAGEAGEAVSTFTVRADPPPPRAMQGLNIVLTAARRGSLKAGDGIYYRQIRVGSVEEVGLSPSAREVEIRVNIQPEYADLIRENTRFWNASGIRVSGGIFSELTVSTESVETLLLGGVALATPDNVDMGNRVKNGHVFTLYDEPEEEWLRWQPNLKLKTVSLLDQAAAEAVRR